MCGITGILHFDSSAGEPSESLLNRMTDTLTHRGPNDRGVWHNHRAGLGSRRLSVIDLSRAGRMPMANEDGSVRLVYNGEVYNFQELKSRFALESRGHHFHSRTDTEVLVHLYEELGLDMVQHLNGMFAIAIWDDRAGQLHLIRDRYGIKPLFYQQDAQHFRYGSEIKAIRGKPCMIFSPLITSPASKPPLKVFLKCRRATGSPSPAAAGLNCAAIGT